MGCCIADMRNKEVISQSDGTRFGNVDDVEFDIHTGQITCLVIYSRGKLFSKSQDIKIPWNKVAVVGDDNILVDFCMPDVPPALPKRKFF